MNLFISLVLRCGIFVLAVVSGIGFAQSQEKIIEPPPVWVSAITVSKPETIPLDQIKTGVYYLLVDRQLKIEESGKVNIYQHFADYIVNQNGLDGSSQINISFDPAYQTLIFHSLRLVREGQSIDKLRTARYSVLQREQELEKLIYDGRLSANHILDDVRVGDIVEYSYSINGTNPVYGDVFSYSFYTQWSVPVKQLFVRALWGKNKPLIVTTFNQAPIPTVKPNHGGTEYVLNLTNISPLQTNSQAPGWYDPYAHVVLTDSEGWEDIVNWAIPLYSDAIRVDDEIKAIANRIRDENKTTDELIYAALVFVQSNIRYLGLEMGESSHKPAPATQTLRRRYGDCKDKTVLLISLLKALDIVAHPALVNTSRYREIAKAPAAATAFDHVIVYLRHDDKDWWLDPTRQHQQQGLRDLDQPDFGYALVVTADETSLKPMNVERLTKQRVIDEFDLSEGSVGTGKYTTTTHYYGSEAERQRNSLAQSSNSEIAEQYLNFYKSYFPNIIATAPLTIDDGNPDKSLSISENYEVPNIWVKGEDSRSTVDFYANNIGAALVEVEEKKRSAPFYLRYPFHVVQTINIQLSDRNWVFDDEKLVEKNPYFKYRSRVTHNKSTNVLQLHYDFQTLTNQVPADQITAYINAREKVIDDIEYSIFEAGDAQNIDSSIYEEYYSYFWAALIILYIGTVVFIIFNWYYDKDRKRYYDQAIFYPISPFKVAVFEVLSFGTYSVYWFYRNWSYVNKIDAKNIMPFWRAFFYSLWFYPFAKRLITGSESKRIQIIPNSFIVLGILAFIYFFAVVVFNLDILVPLALFISTLLLILLVYQVNQFEQPNSEIYRHHSRWRLRHFLALAVLLPLALIYFGETLKIMPSSEVIPGKDILQRDLKFMQRNNLLLPDEKMLYFYSDAFIDIRSDGNGLTDKRILSYWRDDDRRLFVETAKFEDIEDFTFSGGESFVENLTITVNREDGTNFVIYLPVEGGGDQKFRATLDALWRKARVNSEIERAFPRQVTGGELQVVSEGVRTLISSALFNDISSSQKTLADLYSRGLIVKQDLRRALYFYERAHALDDNDASLALAWHLAVADQRVQDAERALLIAHDLIEEVDSVSAREVLAAAYAASGDYQRAAAEQRQALEMMSANKMLVIEAQKKLASYQSSRPWIELWPQSKTGDSPYRPLIKVDPQYPKRATREKISGHIVFSFDLQRNGVISNIEVVDEHPQGYFEAAGRYALDRFIYLPEVINGEAVTTKGITNRFDFDFKE